MKLTSRPRTSSLDGDLFPAEALLASRRTYLAFKDLLELITENCATAVGARIRAESETFIDMPWLPYVRFASNRYRN
jgi:hypothetical protein